MDTFEDTFLTRTTTKTERKKKERNKTIKKEDGDGNGNDSGGIGGDDDDDDNDHKPIRKLRDIDGLRRTFVVLFDGERERDDDHGPLVPPDTGPTPIERSLRDDTHTR